VCGCALPALPYNGRSTDDLLWSAVEEMTLDLATGIDNEKTLAWLEGALEDAFIERKPKLWACLAAVLKEVLFEIELEDL
jgi:hypothetical protein